MPKRVALVSVTVVRDGKRIPTGPGSATAGKAFDYTADEIKDVEAVHPNAFRKPVNESTGEDATAPDTNADATANDTPKKSPKKKAAEKSATSKAATQQDDQQSGEPADTDADDGDADEDEDI